MPRLIALLALLCLSLCLAAPAPAGAPLAQGRLLTGV